MNTRPPHEAKTMTRILIVGNHTCGNRGDCAILRGLLDCLEDALPGCRIDATSRFPVSSESVRNTCSAARCFRMC